MRETLHNFKSTISIEGRIISKLRFGDDIDLMGGSNNELQELQIDCQTVLENMAWRSAAKRAKSWLTMETIQQYRLASMNGQQLEEVMAFKYLGATLTKDGRSTADINIRLAIATWPN